MAQLNSKLLLGFLIGGICMAKVFAAESTKEQNDKAATPNQSVQPVKSAPVEPYGLEGGKFVDKPAEVADNVGREVENGVKKLFGKNDK
jgi:gas vesicle protein